MNEVNNVGKGALLCIIAGAVLTFLKEMGYINWSWIWVTIPFWGPFALIMLALILIVILKLLAKALGGVVRTL